MSRKRTRALRATSLALPAGFLALAITAGCDRSGQESGPTTEPAATDEAAGSTTDPAPAAGEAGGQGATAPAGEAPPSAGQAGGQAGMAGGAAPQGEPISDEELDAFAKAYIQVEDVQGGLEEELRAAESNEEAQEIQQRAMTELQEAVEETGMDFETYGRIAQRLQQDPELIQRVEQAIEAERDES